MKRRIIKHRNRRLYDAFEGKAITLLELSDLVAAGENVAVEHKGTGEDITAVTLLASFAERIRRRPYERLASEVAALLSGALRGAVTDDEPAGHGGGPGDLPEGVGLEP
ncbi:MAG: polyhydroxyalkanoate synthesis regulator DNA-binding domain-containing protein [Candidatus Eisenbacteria bacterium]